MDFQNGRKIKRMRSKRNRVELWEDESGRRVIKKTYADPMNLQKEKENLARLIGLRVPKILQEEKDALVLGADTIVVLEGQVMGKPRDARDAADMLSHLQGRAHEVYTGMCLIDTATGWKKTGAACTKVWFAPMTQDEIASYVATGEPMDKAGAYGIQGLGSPYIAQIEGNYDNVVGLPLALLRDWLKDWAKTCGAERGGRYAAEKN